MESIERRLARLEADNAALTEAVAFATTNLASLAEQWNLFLESNAAASEQGTKALERIADGSRDVKAQLLVLRVLAVGALYAASELGTLRSGSAGDQPSGATDDQAARTASRAVVHRCVVDVWRQMQGELGAPEIDERTREIAVQTLRKMTSWLGLVL